MEGGKGTTGGNVEGSADRRTERSWKERKEGHITAPEAVRSMRTPTYSIQVSTIKILENKKMTEIQKWRKQVEMVETSQNCRNQVEMTGARPEVAFYGAKTRRVTV